MGVINPSGGGAGAVSSVFTRTGAVVAANGDYTAAQVTNALDKASASQQVLAAGVTLPAGQPLYLDNVFGVLLSAPGGANLLALSNASLRIATLGQGLRVAEGANAKQGVATLVAGTVTVANTNVTATSRIILTPQDNNTTGAVRVSARVAATSFTITSSNAGDTGVVMWEIFEPA